MESPRAFVIVTTLPLAAATAAPLVIVPAVTAAAIAVLILVATSLAEPAETVAPAMVRASVPEAPSPTVNVNP